MAFTYERKEDPFLLIRHFNHLISNHYGTSKFFLGAPILTFLLKYTRVYQTTLLKLQMKKLYNDKSNVKLIFGI